MTVVKRNMLSKQEDEHWGSLLRGLPKERVIQMAMISARDNLDKKDLHNMVSLWREYNTDKKD